MRAALFISSLILCSVTQAAAAGSNNDDQFPALSVSVTAAKGDSLPKEWGLDMENIYCDSHESVQGGCDGGVHDHKWFGWPADGGKGLSRERPATAHGEALLPLYVTHLSVRQPSGGDGWADCNAPLCYHGKRRDFITSDVASVNIIVGSESSANAATGPEGITCYITKLTFSDGSSADFTCGDDGEFSELKISVTHSKTKPPPDSFGLDMENKYCRRPSFMSCKDAVHDHVLESWPASLEYSRRRLKSEPSPEGEPVPFHNSWLSVRRLHGPSQDHEWADCHVPWCYIGAPFLSLTSDVAEVGLFVSGDSLDNMMCYVERLTYAGGHTVDVRDSLLCKMFYRPE